MPITETRSSMSKQASFFTLATMVALFSQSLVIPVMSTIPYYDPNSSTPSTGGISIAFGGGNNGDTLPNIDCNCENPPHGGGHHHDDSTTPSNPTPSGHHGGGGGSGYSHSPPTYTPAPTRPSTPSPTTPTLTPPSGPATPTYTTPSPTTPTVTPPTRPATPTYTTPSPTTPTIIPPSGPATPTYTTPSPTTPTVTPPRGPATPTYTPSVPNTPPSGTPPFPFVPNAPPAGSTPPFSFVPNTPSSGTTPPFSFVPNAPLYGTPPFSFDANSPGPFPCTFWRTHPTMIWGLVGWNGNSVNSVFGVGNVAGFGADMNLLQALSNTRTDGLGELYREGTAAMLNAMACKSFPYTTQQVKVSFGRAALSSNDAAAAQAKLFKLANEGHSKPANP